VAAAEPSLTDSILTPPSTPELVSLLGAELSGRDAEEGLLRGTRLEQLLHDAEDGRRGDREAERVGVLGRRDAGRVDADHLADGVDERTPGVAGRDRSVGLDQVDVGALIERAVQRGDDPRSDRVLEPERVADGDRELTHTREVLCEGRFRQALLVGLEDRQIGRRIGHEPGPGSGRRSRGRAPPGSFLDDVVVRDDDTLVAVADDRFLADRSRPVDGVTFSTRSGISS
jgi:hypothetical protein